ncbi:MAG: ribonuclease R [Thermoanaerobaculia bacterium]
MAANRDEALRASIVDLLRKKGNRVLSISDIHERLQGDLSFERDEVESAVERLENEGVLVAVRGKRYSLLEFTPYVSGRISVRRDGHGVLRRPGEILDVLIDRNATRGAMHGDVVLVRIEKRGERTRTVRGHQYVDGEVVRVLQRVHDTVVGRFHAGDYPFIRPFDERLDSDILIEAESTMGARHGEMVNVEIEQYGTRNALARGRIVEVLGMIGDPGVDVEVVIRKYRIPHQFPEEVLASAEQIEERVTPEEVARRRDLRDRVIVTIDSETARDFDDAVEVIPLKNGNYLLGVHIADVSHYVTEGGAIDLEALERGTSVYFPGRVVPMLPERLSNEICSLNPRVDRLTFSVEIEIDRRGRFVDRRMFKSVIRTTERMTYTDVAALLEKSADAPKRKRYETLLPHLEVMRELFEILRVRRDARGSIDFDLPESEIFLTSQGEIESIRPSQRNVAHRLIEEFMLAANEAVAQHLFFAGEPAVFRVHEQPDPQRIEDLKGILEEFHHKLRANPEELRPGDLQRILRTVAGTPEERFLTEIVLRSMKRATYSEENRGHFALALLQYCHFTSPIRRYPDLIVHRRLAALLASGASYGETRERLDRIIPEMAEQSSTREKRAEDAEREVLEWKKVIFMRDKVGMDFAGTVTGVVPFGLFVELQDYFVQGLVPVASIGGDFWKYLEREHRLQGADSGREFRLGDQVVVEVRTIDEDRRQIEFRLVEAGGTAIEERARPKGRPRSRGAR